MRPRMALKEEDLQRSTILLKDGLLTFSFFFSFHEVKMNDLRQRGFGLKIRFCPAFEPRPGSCMHYAVATR